MAPALCRAAPPMLLQSNSSESRATRSSGICKNSKEVAGVMIDKPCGWAGNFMLMMDIRMKILTFRDTIDLPPCDSSGPIHELVMGTIEDFHNLYPNVVPCILDSEMKETSIYQGLTHLYKALKSIGHSWAKNHKWVTDFGYDTDDNLDNISLEQLGRIVGGRLDHMIKIARKMFDLMDEDEKNNDGSIEDSTFGDTLRESYSDNKSTCPSPVTLTSVPPELTLSMKLGEFADVSHSPPFLLPLRLQALGKLKPIDIKCLSLIHMFPNASAQGSNPMKEKNKTVDTKSKAETKVNSIAEELPTMETDERPKDSNPTDNSPKVPKYASNVMPNARGAAPEPPPPPPPSPYFLSPRVSANASPPQSNSPLNVIGVPPPPPVLPSKGSVPAPPRPMPQTKGAAPPPPPPLGAAKALRPKKANTKLKRSTHMGNTYRLLKGKVEGSSLNGKSQGRKSQLGGASGGKQGMADALAEITKRSAYFQQIEEDVQNHAKSIMEIKAAISSFQTKDMAELLKFHKYVEQHLEELTDETQVLARFEGFPSKKLESLRSAVALYSKLEGIAANLENWKIVPPLRQLLDNVESYYNKIKGEVDALERSKDEESKRFQSHNIHFDFNILVRIKESLVDVSSNCMELALKERREAQAAANAESGSKTEEGQKKACVKMLWKAFQLAFRVYSFAGGQDDRADSKKLIRRVQCRLKLLKNKRYSIVRQLREDVGQLLKIGHEQNAFNRVEQLYKDESIMTVYELLDHFCEFIILNLSYIRRNKDCPNDINEAVSSLIFASARCGDLPELRVIRKLFGERYGPKFATTAMELLPGNLVNRQIKERLSIKSVTDDVKHRLVDEIFRDYCLQPGPLALEYSSEWHRQQLQVEENGGDQVRDCDVKAYCNDSSVQEIEGKAIHIDSSINGQKLLTQECHPHGDCDVIGTPTSSIVFQSSPKVADSQHKKAEKTENYAQLGSPYKLTVSGPGTIVNRSSGMILSSTLEHKEERMAAPSSSDSSQFPEETLIYLDDIEEFQSPMSRDGNCQDQRLFMFKSTVPPKVGDGVNESYIEKNDSWIEKAGSRRSSRKSGKTSGKRLRKRSVSREKQSMKDVGCVIYYSDSNWSSPHQNRRFHHHHRQHPKKIRIEDSQQSYYAKKRLQQQTCYVGLRSNILPSKYRYDRMSSCSSCSFNCGVVTDCSLERPCYFCTSDDREELEISPQEQKRRITTLVGLSKHDIEQKKLQEKLSHCGHFGNVEALYNQEMDWVSILQKPRRNYGNRAATCDVLTLPDLRPDKESSERGAEGPDYSSSPGSSNGSNSNVASPQMTKEAHSPYLRAMTMPPERPKESRNDNILRSNSCPFEEPNHLNHVHPKLPNYDELAAKFMALKKDYLQSKHLKQPTLV
ncbi:hypothetical protein L1049_023940 [Liquidambar formosana]|uniref:Uncharacterized protein n=1 Tax=Liquidambar formosana TaxID=63359 RepID=A0AAP0RTN5_LIQFO